MKKNPNKWCITVTLTEEEKEAAKVLCVHLKVGIGAWVMELMRGDLQAHKEGNYAVIRFNPEKLKESLDAQNE